MHEAKIESGEHGKTVKSDGWFVLNLEEAAWRQRDPFGRFCSFEGEHKFEQMGVNVHVLEPGQPACRYHREAAQENFLVLSGECLLIVEGAERPLRAGDFVHCPPGTTHVFVGAGEGPCAILMIGSRTGTDELHYPVDPVAAQHGASVAKATDDPREAYAEFVRGADLCASPWPLGS